MNKMKAILLTDFGGPENLLFADTERPQPGPGQVLIKTMAAAVNKPDVMQRMGQYPAPAGESEILGLEVAGEVEKVGDAVNRFKPGDKVLALVAGGGYAQFTTAYEGHVMHKPESMDYLQAACVCEAYITAYLNLFLIGGLNHNQSVLLHGGGGGVNTAAIQLCRTLISDCRIFVTASPTKVQRVKELGADHVIDYRNQSFADEIKKLTDNLGVDMILDHIGGPYLESNMKSLAVSGTLMQIGVSEGIKAQINLALMMVKRQRIIGSVLRSRPIDEKAEIIKNFSDRVLPEFADKSIVPLISDVLPLAEASMAHQVMESSRHFGKIVLEIPHT